MNLKILALIGALLATIAFAPIACSSEPEVVEKIVEITAVPAEPQIVEKVVEVTPTPGPKGEIVFSDLNWTSAQVKIASPSTSLIRGYGYPTDVVFGATLPLFQGLRRGDSHVTMEIWLPNQDEAWMKPRPPARSSRLAKVSAKTGSLHS